MSLEMEGIQFVSVHGGHSGEFCDHADDTLEAVVEAYIRRGFSWVGITEHVPAASDALRFPDEVAAGISAEFQQRRFARYIAACRELQGRYADKIRIYVGMETEAWRGYETFIPELVRRYSPDYLVGSVHHVADMCIDYSETLYGEAARALGGVDTLYERYFDLQLEMIERLRPAVVGHFDLIRIYDPDYRERLEKPAIRQRVLRNLRRIKDLGAILDLNLRALYKGAEEPYISRSILREAKALGIPVVPGDDSHGVSSVGLHMEEGIRVLKEMGFDTRWKRPA